MEALECLSLRCVMQPPTPRVCIPQHAAQSAAIHQQNQLITQWLSPHSATRHTHRRKPIVYDLIIDQLSDQECRWGGSCGDRTEITRCRNWSGLVNFEWSCLSSVVFGLGRQFTRFLRSCLNTINLDRFGRFWICCDYVTQDGCSRTNPWSFYGIY